MRTKKIDHAALAKRLREDARHMHRVTRKLALELASLHDQLAERQQKKPQTGDAPAVTE